MSPLPVSWTAFLQHTPHRRRPRRRPWHHRRRPRRRHWQRHPRLRRRPRQRLLQPHPLRAIVDGALSHHLPQRSVKLPRRLHDSVRQHRHLPCLHTISSSLIPSHTAPYSSLRLQQHRVCRQHSQRKQSRLCLLQRATTSDALSYSPTRTTRLSQTGLTTSYSMCSPNTPSYFLRSTTSPLVYHATCL